MLFDGPRLGAKDPSHRKFYWNVYLSDIIDFDLNIVIAPIHFRALKITTKFNPKISTDLSIRFRVLAVLVSYWLPLTPLAISGGEGFWMFRLLLAASSPLIAIAALAAVIFAHAIVRRPILWAVAAGICAVVLSTVGTRIMFDSFAGVMSSIIAVPAVGVFIFISKRKPIFLWP